MKESDVSDDQVQVGVDLYGLIGRQAVQIDVLTQVSRERGERIAVLEACNTELEAECEKLRAVSNGKAKTRT